MKNVITGSCCQQKSLLLCSPLCLYQPGQTPSTNVPASSLFKQLKHFILLPWKRASHPRAEREPFLSRPQSNQNQSCQCGSPAQNTCVSKSIFARRFVSHLCELRRILKQSVNLLVLDLILKLLYPGIWFNQGAYLAVKQKTSQMTPFSLVFEHVSVCCLA